MEPEGSLPHSQELSTCPCPEPDQSSTHHLYRIHPNIIHLRLSLPSVLLPSDFPTNNLYVLLFPPFVLHSQSTSLHPTSGGFILILSTYVLVFLVTSFPLTFPPTTYTCSSSPIRATFPVHITPSHLCRIHPNIIHLCLGLPSDLLPSDFPTNNLSVLLFPHSCYIIIIIIIQFNSIQFFIIYVPSLQLQGQLQTQHSANTTILLLLIIIIIQ
jgi:hypothetical protein